MAEAQLPDWMGTALRDTGDATECVVRHREGGLTRFANNGVHQHAEVSRTHHTVRVCADGRCGVASLTGRGEGDAREAFDRVCAQALAGSAFGPGAPSGLPGPGGAPLPMDNYCAQTASTQPDDRVRAVRRFTEAATQRGLTAAGAFATDTFSLTVANSQGIATEHRWTDAHFSATLMRPEGGSAWVERRAVDVATLDLDGAHATVFDKAERAAQVETLPPGKYMVLLEPAAVGELLQFLVWLGLGARQYLDGTSFMTDKLGTRITGDAVTIVDDCHHPGMPGAPCDYEGVPRHRLPLIENGIARAVAYDTTTGAEAQAPSTGHALPQPNSIGPLPLHLVMAPGDTPRDELLAQVDDGILVTRLWYNRVVDPGRTLITGLTRDGTFRIRNGALGPRVQDFRYNESILEAFTRIAAMSDTLERVERGFVPAMVIEDFTFSSVSGTT